MLEHSHLLGHSAIVTKLDLPESPFNTLVSNTRPNWSKSDWAAYTKELGIKLGPSLTHLRDSRSNLNPDWLAEKITLVINHTITASTRNLNTLQLPCR